MEIKKASQYNISSSKFKMLSSTSGVGSVVPTKWGGFIMPLNINEWKFIQVLTESINDQYKSDWPVEKHANETGVEIIDDERFIDFLIHKKEFVGLKAFATIPHVQLSMSNYIKSGETSINKELIAKGKPTLPEDYFYIPAVNFPKWFISKNYELKSLIDWRIEWHNRRCNDGNYDYFAPPRDPNNKTQREMKYENGLADKNKYGLLEPVTLVLICPNGHISDVDWYKYFCAKLDKIKVDAEEGFELFNYQCQNHCKKGGDHKLQWIVNRNQSESWGILKCSKCGETVSLSGVMNMKPYCRGEKPWEPSIGNLLVPNHEMCGTPQHRTIMQVAMVTSNAIYYAHNISSLYIPKQWTSVGNSQLSIAAQKALTQLDRKYTIQLKKNAQLIKEDFFNKIMPDANTMVKYSEVEFEDDLAANDYEPLRKAFLGISDEIDILGTYRKEEFDVFMNNDTTPEVNPKLDFNDVAIPVSLSEYLLKIKQVPMLAVTSTQLGFGRVKMPSAKLNPDTGKIEYPEDQIRPIYSGHKNDVRVLPANQVYGEGLFFAFDSEKIKKWAQDNKLEEYYSTNLEVDSMGEFLNSEMGLYGRAKFYLLHTFSHLIMKELEFSCGYPTASLSERLYYSDEMCGVLIYTADGAEGSMGGLVWQGQTDRIERIILSALERAQDCSSDPLCWENNDGLNKAACFSCAMVSETSCERFNMGLDRRALVDSTFGYFKEFVIG